MKKVSKGIEPARLRHYRTQQPANTWEQFRSTQDRRIETQQRLIVDQGGLCAYCEIDLLQSTGHDESDFRVEHFHPKSGQSTPHNWHLDWQNLLGCCHGGSQRNVVDAGNRFTSPDSSCDVPKGDKNLDGVILNPLLIPAFPRLFSCDRASGHFSVDANNCLLANINAQTAQNTIDELHLDAERLKRLRSAVLNDLNAQLQTLVTQGMSIGIARERLAKAILRKNASGHWPKFFTSIRSYLGDAAETHLSAINYNG
ncbi:retron system putative HNH endonuclease [Marinomonas fungiae]|uniref:TIGR02646 family protein n=1 Tax=Marinomonas fungiae TaxID=1137284 RepID=A0A0K6IFZ0_9GAMM|nr:retron system putative HNH endonuclease [Marinomonas fungiae]CUB02272.1 TIGR02646 family protein [Marinomonas fungiae]